LAERRRNSGALSTKEFANYGGAVKATTEKPKRVRNRKASLQLQAALNDAEQLDGALHDELTIARMKLIQTRLTVLNRKAVREQEQRREQLVEQVKNLKAENERLTRQHERDSEEITRLRSVCRTESGATFDEIAMRGQNGRI
jgi:hypothetical protein